MNMLKTYLKKNYHVSNYQIAQIEFLFKTIFSELSKMLIMGILFYRYIDLYLFALCVMFYLRTTTGGMHFYTYAGCLTASILYMWTAVVLLPNVVPPLPSCLQTAALLISILICYFTGPVVSKYRPELSRQLFCHFRDITCKGIFAYALILYIIPDNRYLQTGFWIIILHSLQLYAAKIRKKGEYTT